MIRIVKRGTYQLIKTEQERKLFILEKSKAFVWEKNDIYYTQYDRTHHEHSTLLAHGSFFLYDVLNESTLTNVKHWEVFTEKKTWKGFLIPDGFPTKKDMKKPMMTTDELITKTTLQY